jgi:hypothetical protein
MPTWWSSGSVSPESGTAKQAGLTVDGGVLVDEYLHERPVGPPVTSHAGRTATGTSIRVEHWVVAGSMVKPPRHLGSQSAVRHRSLFWAPITT